ncbi:MAG TPA: spermine synthase [Chloroflexota bacterium]|nr:spermine synthase [Chloroflexota bacterium]
MAGPIVLSHIQTGAMLEAREHNQANLITTLDLGVSRAEVALDSEGVAYQGTGLLDWDAIRTIVRQAPMCFLVEHGTAAKIHRFSETLNRPYSLMATTGWPTLVNSGFTMHRIVGIDPGQDTQEKIRALGTPRGRVLDTTTGLGYTAIAAARQANEVITVELDPLVLEIAGLNPWSRELFENPRISRRIGDSSELIVEFPDRHFTQIIHDPPTLSLAGDLYGGAFYRQLFRVLIPGGTLFHYVGNPASRQGGMVAKGVIRRLHEAGFTKVATRPRAFGVVATRP